MQICIYFLFQAASMQHPFLEPNKAQHSGLQQWGGSSNPPYLAAPFQAPVTSLLVLCSYLWKMAILGWGYLRHWQGAKSRCRPNGSPRAHMFLGGTSATIHPPEPLPPTLQSPPEGQAGCTHPQALQRLPAALGRPLNIISSLCQKWK